MGIKNTYLKWEWVCEILVTFNYLLEFLLFINTYHIILPIHKYTYVGM